jgi:hypothetical protein
MVQDADVLVQDFWLEVEDDMWDRVINGERRGRRTSLGKQDTRPWAELRPGPVRFPLSFFIFFVSFLFSFSVF